VRDSINNHTFFSLKIASYLKKITLTLFRNSLFFPPQLENGDQIKGQSLSLCWYFNIFRKKEFQISQYFRSNYTLPRIYSYTFLRNSNDQIQLIQNLNLY